MIKDIHEFLEEHYNRLDGGVATPEEIHDMVNELLEMSGSDVSACKSYYRNLMMYMFKYFYQKDHQIVSWVKTIWNCQRELDDILSGSKALERRGFITVKDQYLKARRDASLETHLSLSVFPSVCPNDWTGENLSNRAGILGYL